MVRNCAPMGAKKCRYSYFGRQDRVGSCEKNIKIKENFYGTGNDSGII